MKPLRPGQARTELAEEINRVLLEFAKGTERIISPEESKTLAALVGGAIEETLNQMNFPKDQRTVFWRITTHSLWSLVRSLQASGKLLEIK